MQHYQEVNLNHFSGILGRTKDMKRKRFHLFFSSPKVLYLRIQWFSSATSETTSLTNICLVNENTTEDLILPIGDDDLIGFHRCQLVSTISVPPTDSFRALLMTGSHFSKLRSSARAGGKGLANAELTFSSSHAVYG